MQYTDLAFAKYVCHRGFTWNISADNIIIFPKKVKRKTPNFNPHLKMPNCNALNVCTMGENGEQFVDDLRINQIKPN